MFNLTSHITHPTSVALAFKFDIEPAPCLLCLGRLGAFKLADYMSKVFFH
jgi:hypothetical protein